MIAGAFSSEVVSLARKGGVYRWSVGHFSHIRQSVFVEGKVTTHAPTEPIREGPGSNCSSTDAVDILRLRAGVSMSICA